MVCTHKIRYNIGKNGCHRPRGLGSRLIVCGQAVNKTLFTIILQLQFWSTFRLFEYIISVNNFIPVDLRLVFGANASYIVWLLNWQKP